ncbi:uncharacterized protein M6B38_156175 [Iris pallida]|uniref:Trigger factor n=1 Tax=Iris pallida TaxID=29817 RepID=A0AAX6F3F5_IRIPA|nr:uncharacterized protein M6B38_156175 [Iris pallida]
MEVVAVRNLLVDLIPKISNQKQRIDLSTQVPCSLRTVFNARIRNLSQVHQTRSSHRTSTVACLASQGLQERTLDKSPLKGFTVSAKTSRDGEIKMKVDVTGAKTQVIFDDVFSKLVDDAQPIPGFRRVKGGKTPDKGLKVTKELRVEQSFEELEAAFVPGKDFSFDATIHHIMLN